MKHLKKLLVVVAALAMAMAMSAVAWAAESYPITINNDNATAEHTYSAYQVFSGTLSQNEYGQNVLTNVGWGSGVNGGDLLAELKALTDSPYANCGDAAAVAKVLEKFVDNSAQMEAFAEAVGKHLTTVKTDSTHADGDLKQYTIDPGEPGYYIIKEGVNPEQQRSASGFMIEVLGPATMNVKDQPMTPDKNIEQGNVKVKAGTANVGDTVNFVVDQIKVPSTDGYKSFKFVMKDTLPKGLTFGQVTSVKLDKGGTALAADAYTVTATENNDGTTELRVAIKDALTVLKPYEGKEVEIKYTATVNANAEFGNTGNKNEVVFEFSNNPDKASDGNPDFGPDEPHGTTPKSETTTYVTKIVIKKVDEKKAALGGAVFKLSGESKNVVVTTGEHFVEAADGTYYLLKDGTYTTTAPTDATADKYADPAKKYKLEKYEATELNGKDNVDVTAVSDSKDGEITFAGLKPGTYALTETGAPVGYNKIEQPISFKIDFVDDEFVFDGKAPDGVVMLDDGTVQITIENQSGSTLPSTGGMGTTILYVVGGIMVLLAVVFLITKKRVASKKNESEMI